MKNDISFDKQAVISFSGGMDSTCLMMYLLSKGYKVNAYSFDYGQAHSVELRLAKKNIKYLQKLGLPVNHQIINLRDVFSGDTSTLVRHEKSPEGDYREETMKQTFVNNRNCIFSAIIFAKALSLARPTHQNVLISMGLHSGDHFIYLDAREESVNMARELFRISNWDSELVEYDAPFVNISKSEVLGKGLEAMKALGMTKSQINKVLKNTMTCYNATPDGKACGKCGSCNERLQSFQDNNMEDPIQYV